ncbi:hypothetical protein QBC47DRAFT_457417 [Echria macrotheca]|uniref:Uncharacterized protein n=1 Tax=Echria macrotheca TaxID=438768 RepID=A0AAJ0F9G8_9PEZI|nr:hypothetical protein QBC47DRAFT_457417 [Echria macrotheca]
MKSFAAAVFLLSSITGTIAAPSGAKVTRQNSCPSAGDITDNINGWQNDINSVNGFLNSVASLTSVVDISNGAVNALSSAEDEPNRLMFFAQLCSCGSSACNSDFSAAVSALQSQFGGVLSNLIDAANDVNTIASPNPASVVAPQINNINQLRCCVVLPSAQTIFTNAAASVAGVSASTSVARENACSSITC